MGDIDKLKSISINSQTCKVGILKYVKENVICPINTVLHCIQKTSTSANYHFFPLKISLSVCKHTVLINNWCDWSTNIAVK